MKIRRILKNWSQAHWLFAFIALVGGGLFIYVTPPLWGIDEMAHFPRAYQITNLQLEPKRLETTKGYGAAVSEGMAAYIKYVGEDTAYKPEHKAQFDTPKEYTKLDATSLNGSTHEVNFSGAGIYPAFVYTAPVIGIAVAKVVHPTVGTALYLARIFTLLSYVLLVGACIYQLRHMAMKWAVVFVALLPMSLFQAATVNADSFVIMMAILFFTELVILLTEKALSQTVAITLSIAAVALALTKPTYLLLVAILPFVVTKNIVENAKLRFMLRWGVLAISTVATLLWFMAIRLYVSGPIKTVNLGDQLHLILTHPLGYAHVLIHSAMSEDWVTPMFGMFGQTLVTMPTILAYVLALVGGLTAFIALQRTTKLPKISHKTGWYFVIVSVLAAIAVATTLYLSWTPVGGKYIQGVQGRYFIPGLIFLIAGVGAIARKESHIEIEENTAARFYGVTMLLCALASVWWYYNALYY